MPVVACFTLSQPQDVNAFSSDSIATGNIPTALSMPGTAGLSLLPQYLVYQPTVAQGLSLPTQQQSGTNTNTFQSSSWSSNPLTNIYDILSPIPGDIASTAANLANWFITPPGYTPGGAPFANFDRRLLDWFYNFLLVGKPFEYPSSERV